MPVQQLIRKDILYPELSYQIIGILFDISNSSGYGYQEKYYQRAISKLLRDTNMRFREQVPTSVMIKKGERFLKQNIDQLHSYLKATGLELGILANFTQRGLQFKRIVNIRNSNMIRNS